MTQPIALIIDDEPDIRELLSITLKRMDIQPVDAENITQGKALLEQHDVSLCLTDMRLPDGNGIELVEYMQREYPHIPVAVITAFGNMELAISALKAGAFDFVSKPVNLKVLRDLVNTALKLSHRSQASEQTQRNILGESESIQLLRAMIQKLARSQAPVLISGSSGTGKELVARMIHEQGPRADMSFIAVNCGAIPQDLMESEFFGHKKGSFTGAVADKDGLFQAAQGGTLFLDEIAELPIHMQVKLLRVIQEKAVRPVGGQAEVPVDVRILSATHKDLSALVATNEFRQDLYYRINVIELTVPDLKDRSTDIPILVTYFLQRLAVDLQLTELSIATDALDKLMCYEFPGNIRELENILERAATLCENNQIAMSDIELKELVETSEHHQQTDRQETTGSSEQQQTDLSNYMDSVEKQQIQAALEETRWNKTAAAKKLGITLRALRYRLKKLGLE